VLSTLGRADLLKTKLFALCDRGTDLSDCVALAPTAAELDEAVLWLAEQDANPGPAHVNATSADLTRRLGHGV
jgi:N-acetylglucosamine-6-phosphate deacetylase